MVALLAAIAMPLLLVLNWPSCSRSIVVPTFVSIGVGWLLLVQNANIDATWLMVSIAERREAGQPLEAWERTYDGAGERAFSLLFGWLVPTLVATLALAFRWLRRAA